MPISVEVDRDIRMRRVRVMIEVSIPEEHYQNMNAGTIEALNTYAGSTPENQQTIMELALATEGFGLTRLATAVSNPNPFRRPDPAPITFPGFGDQPMTADDDPPVRNTADATAKGKRNFNLD